MATPSPLTAAQMAREVQASGAMRAVFTQVYLGPHNPLDALAWAVTSGSVGPTGTLDPRTDDEALEAALRRALSSRPTKARRWRRLALRASPVAAILLAVSTVGAIAIAATIASRPTPSLAVFARAQTSEEQSVLVDASMGMVPGTLRFLGGQDDVEFAAYQTVLDDNGTEVLNVCLAVRGEPGNVACVPFDVVARQGITGTHQNGTTHYSFVWGPTGGLAITVE